MTEPRASDHRSSARARGFVVAGGRSSRMGRDKALLPYRGSTLLEHAIDTAREVTDDLQILCGRARRYEDFGVPVVEDAICGVGPIGGLYSALLSASMDRVERVFWLAVDVPLVKASLLGQLVAELDHAEVAMPRTSNGIEPLCAAFQTAPALQAVRRALLAGRLKLTDATLGLNLKTVKADAESFVNLNSPEEYDRITTRGR